MFRVSSVVTNAKVGLHSISRRDALFLISLSFLLLFSSLVTCLLVPDAKAQSTVHVGTEGELKNAINNAALGVPLVVALERDINP
jgi:hypothetical protein